jgi:undecaprenyl-diphosphatase
MIRRYDNGMNFVSTQYTVTGYQRSDIDVVATVLVFTLVYALLRACFMLYV